MTVRSFILSLMCIGMLTGCATSKNIQSPASMSELAQGQRDFEAGYYKTSLQRLLPLAAEGNAEAQYAVGYMYYYGLGVTQDTEVGAIWVDRSAGKNYQPAIDAKKMMVKK